jgi:hypothetical protein
MLEEMAIEAEKTASETTKSERGLKGRANRPKARDVSNASEEELRSMFGGLMSVGGC